MFPLPKTELNRQPGRAFPGCPFAGLTPESNAHQRWQNGQSGYKGNSSHRRRMAVQPAVNDKVTPHLSRT